MAYNAYWSLCTLALRVNGSSIVDDKGHTITNTDVTLSTTVSDSGGKSGYFNGSSAVLEIAQGAGIAGFGEADFSIPFSFYTTQTAGNAYILWLHSTADNGLMIWRVYDELHIEDYYGQFAIIASGITENALYKAMLVRDGDTLRLFLNGSAAGTADVTGFSIGGTDVPIYLGANQWGDSGSFIDGYLDEVYIVPGIALETAAYTPAAIFDAPVEFTPGTGTASVPVNVTVQGSGSLVLPVIVSVGSSGSCAVGVTVSVVSAAILSGLSTVSDGSTAAAVWSPRVEIDGVDVTDDLIGPVEVDGSEGDARIASFALAIPPGTAVSLPDYVGAEVLVEIADADGNNRMRLFSGKLNLPDLDLQTRTIRCSCTDDLQNRLAATTRDYLDSLIGGRWSAAVFDKGAGSWRYAQDMLTTVPKSLDISPYGQLRVTPWLAKTTVDLDFDDASIMDGSVAVSFAERSALVNEVNLDFGYRFPRIKSEGYHIDFAYLTNGFSDWVNDGGGFLFRSAVSAAIEQAGGSIVSISYVALPTTAQIVGGGFWIPNPATDPLMCLGFEAVVSFDYTQDVDETHAIRVYNQSSIDAVGLITDRLSGALAGVALDNSAAETNILLYKNAISKIPPLTSPSVVSGQTNAAAITLTAETDRAAAEAAMETLIDVAKVRIAASHRASTVAAAVPLNPAVDVDKTIAVAAQGVVAQGKCVSFKHRMEADSGRATTEFSIAVCSLTGLGIADAGEATAAPAGTVDGVTSTLADPVCVYNGLLGQDQSFAVTFPAVAANERNAAAITISTGIAAPLVEDTLTITL